MKSTILRLPQEQIDILLSNPKRLRDYAEYVHYRYLNYSFGNEYTAQDIIQESWADILTAKRFPPPDVEQLFAWARTIIRNRCVNMMEKTIRSRELCYNYLNHFQESDHEVKAAQVKELLVQARKRLDPKIVQVIEYRAAGIPEEQVAKALGVPWVSLRGRFFRGKQVLKKLTGILEIS